MIVPKYQYKAKLCFMDTDRFIIHIQTEDVYEDIANDVVKKRFVTANCELNRPLPKGKNQKVIGLMKDELGGKIMTQFVGFRPKIYSYLIDDDIRKLKEQKKYVMKRILKFNDYKNR